MSCHLGTKRYEALMSSIVYNLFGANSHWNKEIYKKSQDKKCDKKRTVLIFSQLFIELKVYDFVELGS